MAELTAAPQDSLPAGRAQAARPGGEDRPLAGIGFMIAAIFLLCLQDALAKFLTESFSVTQILAFRGFTGLVVILLAAAAGRAALRVPRGLRLLVAGRILCSGLAAATLYTGLQTVPLAEATALLMTSPMIITGLAALLLGERVGWQSWVAVVVGFAGCLVVLQPADLEVELGEAIIMSGALAWSLSAILTRRIGSGVSAATQLLYLNLAFFLVCGAALPADWQTPDLPGAALLLLLGAIGLFSQAALIHGYRLASPAVVAPFEYTALLWSALLGYAIWGEVPETHVWTGALLIAAAGLYIANREGRPARSRRPG